MPYLYYLFFLLTPKTFFLRLCVPLARMPSFPFTESLNAILCKILKDQDQISLISFCFLRKLLCTKYLFFFFPVSILYHWWMLITLSYLNTGWLKTESMSKEQTHNHWINTKNFLCWSCKVLNWPPLSSSLLQFFDDFWISWIEPETRKEIMTETVS